MTHYEITIAVDTPEAEEFAAWLNAQGYSASVGNSTGSYVNGVWTNSDEESDQILDRLWVDYCNR